MNGRQSTKDDSYPNDQSGYEGRHLVKVDECVEYDPCVYHQMRDANLSGKGLNR